MIQHNTLNVKFSNSHLNEFKPGIKNNTEVRQKLSSNGDSKDDNNFPHNLLLTKTEGSKVCKAFANDSPANIKLSKTQLHKIGQSGGFLGRLLGPFLKHGTLGKNFLISLVLTASATDSAIHKKMFGSGTVILIISNVELNDVMEIVKSLEECTLSIKDVSETNKFKEAKEQKRRFLSMLLGTLGASLLGNLLTGKEVMRTGEGRIRVGQNV